MAKSKAKAAKEKIQPKETTEASSKKRPASPTRPHGPRGNHAPVITGPPPTPPKTKNKTKRKRVESEDETEPPLKKKKGSKKASVSPEEPKHKPAKPADSDRTDRDRHESTSGKSGRKNPPRSSSATAAPPSGKTSTSTEGSSPPTSTKRGSSSGRSSTPTSSSHRAPPPVPPNALENAVNAFKGLTQGDAGSEDLDLGDYNPRKTLKDTLKPVYDEELDDDEEDEEEEAEQDEAEDEGDEDDEDDDEDEDDEDDEDEDADDGEELSAREVDEFLTLIRSLKKKTYALNKKQSDPKTISGHFKTWGRHAHRLCGIYTDIHDVITTGMTVVKANPKAAKFYTKKFFHLCDQVPKFKLLCQHLLSRWRGMLIFAKFFENHAAAGRSTDISTIKRNFHSYLPIVELADGTVIPPLSVNQYAKLKSRNAGYYSDCSARLVVPINERDVFDQEPHEYAMHKNTQRKEREKDAARPRKHHKHDRPKRADGRIDDEKTFSSFLFPTILEYDDANPQRGIFKSDICVTVTRHLFKGPSTVGRDDGESGFGRTCLADIYKITYFAPDYLAYVATLIRHLLSIDGRWREDRTDRGHRFHTALHTIVSVDFDAWKEDRARADTERGANDSAPIDETNENIFAHYNSFDLEDDDDEGNLRVRILAARKAELAARHDPLPKKGKQRATSEDLLADEEEQLFAREASVEFVEGPPPSDPDVNAGTGSGDDRMADE
ncbi:hypothetical protein LXA43DRAFT_1105486 [Ganoderma leucocontextum]|nr:hypothetical protein LXA43DRAFT_1105486 [Ganoderma leucocontextum]